MYNLLRDAEIEESLIATWPDVDITPLPCYYTSSHISMSTWLLIKKIGIVQQLGRMIHRSEWIGRVARGQKRLPVWWHCCCVASFGCWLARLASSGQSIDELQWQGVAHFVTVLSRRGINSTLLYYVKTTLFLLCIAIYTVILSRRKRITFYSIPLLNRLVISISS